MIDKVATWLKGGGLHGKAVGLHGCLFYTILLENGTEHSRAVRACPVTESIGLVVQ